MVVLVLFPVGLALFGISAFGRTLLDAAFGTIEPLPIRVVQLHCGWDHEPYPEELTAGERETLSDLVDFAGNHADRTVYLALDIERQCAACACARGTEAWARSDDRPAESIERGSLYIDRTPASERSRDLAPGQPLLYREGVQLTVFMPGGPLASGVDVFLPQYAHLTDPHYRSYQYGSYLAFEGLFVVRYDAASGGDAIRFEPMQPPEGLSTAVDCLRGWSQLTALQRLYKGCRLWVPNGPLEEYTAFAG